MKILVTFAKQEIWTLELNEEKFETYTKGFQAICNDIRKIQKWMVFFSTFSSTWGQKCHTYPPLKIKTGQGSQSCGHTNRLFCFLRHRLCCSCLLGGRSWITLFFSIPFDPTLCKQAVLNGKENISGKWFQYSWNCLPCITNLLAPRTRSYTGKKQSWGWIGLDKWMKNNYLTPIT